MVCPMRNASRALLARLGWAFALLVAAASLGEAATLQLSFDQTSFSSVTSGSFRLTGEIPATGYGSASSQLGIDYYSFSSDYTPGFTVPPPVPFDFALQATAASGTAVRDAVSYTIKSQPGIRFDIFGTTSFGQVQMFLTPTPDPNFGPEGFLPDGTQGTFLVDITGSFTATGSANGSSPASEGVTLGNLAGTSFNQNPATSSQTLAVTVAVPVPEPTTAALATLAAAALLLHGRRLIALSR